jgi:predicted DNA-binding transcriptional regulator YafY
MGAGERFVNSSKPAGISDKVIRLLDIYTMIAQKKYPSVAQIAERMAVSERSVFRYLEIINLIDAIEFDPERKGYLFTSGDRIKKLSLKEEELTVLLAAGEAVSHLGKSLGESFQELLGRLATTAKKAGGKKPPIIIKIPDVVASETVRAYFKMVSCCIDEKRSMEMTYRAQHTGEVTERLVDPYGMVFYEGVWIMVGYCHLRKQIRTFAFDRILSLKERYRYFTPKDGFNLDDYFSRSWGIYDDKEVAVTMRFSQKIADYVLRKKWHPSEKRKVLASGDVEITYTVAGTGEIKRWIYSWLPHVEVIKPAWFRKQVGAELAAGAKRHAAGQRQDGRGKSGHDGDTN